ncbi:MAG: hypothetical protein ACLUI3_16370 [Christensenellales bacterium]
MLAVVLRRWRPDTAWRASLREARTRRAAGAVPHGALALPTLTTETQSDLYLRYGETYNPYMYGTEYTMEGTNFAYTRDKNPHVEQGEISLTAYAKRGTKIEMQVEAQTDGVISVPLFGYDGYCAQADGQELETGLTNKRRRLSFRRARRAKSALVCGQTLVADRMPYRCGAGADRRAFNTDGRPKGPNLTRAGEGKWRWS